MHDNTVGAYRLGEDGKIERPLFVQAHLSVLESRRVGHLGRAVDEL